MMKSIFLALLLPLVLQAKIVLVSDTSSQAFSNAYQVAVSGDIVAIPPGDSRWDIGFTIDKDIWIVGAGTNATTIRAGTFNLGNSASRVSHINFIRYPTSTSSYIVQARNAGWRTDHCLFQSGNGIKCISTYPNGGTGTVHPPSGLIDHCTLLQTRILVQGDISNGFG